MTIEWVPRSRRGEGGWRTATGSAPVPAPVADEVDGLRAVRVPVVPQRGGASPFRGWVVLILIVNLGQVMRGARNAWSSLSLSFWLVAAVSVVLLFFLYRAMRLRAFTGRDHPDVMLSAAGIHTAGMVVPWTSVDEVVRFGFLTGPGRGGPGPRSFLAVRVDDFVAVRGLTPARAGLANLTRRRLVVLCESREVHAPAPLADALDLLVANPAARELLSGAEGVRLVSVGPPGLPGPVV